MKKFIIAVILFASFNSFSMLVDSNNDITISRVSLLQMASANLCTQAAERNENKVREYILQNYVGTPTPESSDYEASYAQIRKNTEAFLNIPGGHTTTIFENFTKVAKSKISEDAVRERRSDVVAFLRSLDN